MKYTLADAIAELKGNNPVYTDEDLTSKINKAIRSLSGMRGWQCLRRVLRFSSAGPRFVLPQGCAGLVRVCVNGRPSTVRGQDFRFLQSGPGDITAGRARPVPPGFTKVGNVLEDGTTVLMSEPYGPFRVFAYKDSPTGSASFTLTGTDIGGRRIRQVVQTPYDWPVYDAHGEITSGTEVADAETLPFVFTSVDSIVIDEGATTNITLYAEDAESYMRFPIALYRPDVRVPSFKRYLLPDVRPGQPVELFVEARVDPLPLVNMTDVLPFETIEPIEWMIRSDWEMRSGEVSKGESYRNNAANWLMAQEIADDTVQTSFVINSPYAGSPGEISKEAENI